MGRVTERLRVGGVGVGEVMMMIECLKFHRCSIVTTKPENKKMFPPKVAN